MGSHIFGFFGVRHFFTFTVSKRTRMFALWVKSRVFFIQLKKWVNLQKWKVTKLGSRKLHICPKMTKMGSIIGHKIDYNGVGALRGQRHIHSKNSPRYPPRGECTISQEQVARFSVLCMYYVMYVL